MFFEYINVFIIYHKNNMIYHANTMVLHLVLGQYNDFIWTSTMVLQCF